MRCMQIEALAPTHTCLTAGQCTSVHDKTRMHTHMRT